MVGFEKMAVTRMVIVIIIIIILKNAGTKTKQIIIYTSVAKFVNAGVGSVMKEFIV